MNHSNFYNTSTLFPCQWAILERVGRARYQGEVTQGKLSLQFMNENPKTLFYHRKALLSKGLMLKQVHHQKTKGQNFQGTLFHIPRLDLIFIVRMSLKFVVTFIIAGFTSKGNQKLWYLSRFKLESRRLPKCRKRLKKKLPISKP